MNERTAREDIFEFLRLSERLLLAAMIEGMAGTRIEAGQAVDPASEPEADEPIVLPAANPPT